MVMEKTSASEISIEEIKFDVVREMNELRNQISLIKRIGFFFGAGSSMAVGIPGIFALTNRVKDKLSKEDQKTISTIEESIRLTQKIESPITIEDILNQIRLIRQITKDSNTQAFSNICGEQAKRLDIKICKSIYEIISLYERTADFSIIKKFVSCINWFSREYTKEIFTTNYDLLFEKSFESLLIPYYDGFVGANEPFFLPESIETGSKLDYPPVSWIRLWKIHGSLGWFWKNNDSDSGSKVIRLGVQIHDNEIDNNELVIYPSKEKYELSRKQPFIAYFDRLKHYLNEGEGIFILSGYSFGDQHINEIFFNALQQNNRLHIIAFLFSDSDMDKVRSCCRPYLNFSAYSPSYAIISGNFGRWDQENLRKDGVEEEVYSKFWDSTKNELKLGDFRNLVHYLVEISGKKNKILSTIKGE